MNKKALGFLIAVVFIGIITLSKTNLIQQEISPGEASEDESRAMTEAICITCHRFSTISNSVGHTHDGWQALIDSMIILPKEQNDIIVNYLARNYPTKPGTGPVLIPGPVNVNIKEWMAPTLGSRPHDPLAASDNTIWWTGQMKNRLGKVDPSTGEMHEFPLEVEDSGPHGLVEDKNGNIWFTAVSGDYIGMLNPVTGSVDEYPVPDGTRGPHTPIFDQIGTLWFTLQSGHVGRFVPETEEMIVTATPTSGTYPYGIQVNSTGVPWYVDFRGNRVGNINPETLKITEYELPHPDSRPRRIAITPDDVVWYTDYPRGYLGRFDPETGNVQEWLSPGGSQSKPYGITSTGNVIWYSETSMRPNTLVRFDTETQQFQSWEIPSGGGIVRMMMATADGDLVLACSGVNRVALVKIGT